MNRFKHCTGLLVLVFAAPAFAQRITNVVETGGDNEATDTITAKWTGQTFNRSVLNEPDAGAIGTPFTVPTFGNLAPTYVDRNHRYANHTVDPAAIPPGFTIPAYLLGQEYIMAGNDNRDNNAAPTLYRLDVTVAEPSRVYMLIDNRLGGNAADPPTFDSTHMQWMLDQAWIPTNNGLNRAGNPAVPDEVPLDEGADNTIQNWFSVYRKDVPAGTFTLLQPDNGGQNMYGVVVGPVPEPSSITLVAGGLALLMRRRR